MPQSIQPIVFFAVQASSEDSNCSLTNLAQISHVPFAQATEGGKIWRNDKNCSFPVSIEIKLAHRTRLDNVVLASPAVDGALPPTVKVFVKDQSDSSADTYRRVTS